MTRWYGYPPRILWEHGGVSLTGTEAGVAERIQMWPDDTLRRNGLRALEAALEHPHRRAECGQPPVVVRVTIRASEERAGL